MTRAVLWFIALSLPLAALVALSACPNERAREDVADVLFSVDKPERILTVTTDMKITVAPGHTCEEARARLVALSVKGAIPKQVREIVASHIKDGGKVCEDVFSEMARSLVALAAETRDQDVTPSEDISHE
jgi:hypothetical protein